MGPWPQQVIAWHVGCLARHTSMMRKALETLRIDVFGLWMELFRYLRVCSRSKPSAVVLIALGHPSSVWFFAAKKAHLRQPLQHLAEPMHPLLPIRLLPRQMVPLPLRLVAAAPGAPAKVITTGRIECRCRPHCSRAMTRETR